MVLTTQELRSAVEEYTGLSWQVETEQENRIVFSRASYLYEFEKKGEVWELRIYDETESVTDAKWSVGPVDAENVVSEVSQFTPKELQRK